MNQVLKVEDNSKIQFNIHPETTQNKKIKNKIGNYGNQSMIPAVAILICLSSSTSKAQIGEKGCSEIVDKRKGDMGLETKDI